MDRNSEQIPSIFTFEQFRYLQLDKYCNCTMSLLF